MKIILSIEDLLVYVEQSSYFTAIFFLPITYPFSIGNRLKSVSSLYLQILLYVAMKDYVLNHRLVMIVKQVWHECLIEQELCINDALNSNEPLKVSSFE